MEEGLVLGDCFVTEKGSGEGLAMEKQIEEWLDLWKGVGKGLVREKWIEE
jgi:hypothetical protein